MRILITGASGLLGLNLALEFARDQTVLGVVNEHPVDFSNARAMPAAPYRPFEVIRADLLGRENVLTPLLDISRPEVVIHCAALANLDACEANPQLAQALNTELPGKLARWTAKRGVRLVHISTDAVFDGQRGGYTEEDVPNPLSAYARTKLEGERAVLAADPQAIVARLNIFGWSLNGKRSLAEFFFNNLRFGQTMPGFTDVFFCPLLVNDLAAVLGKMLAKNLQGLYHLVSRDSLTKYEFGVALARRFGFDEKLIQPVSVQEAGLKTRRSPVLTLKTDKLAAALGESLPAFLPALERFYELYRQGYPQFLRTLGQEVPTPAQ